MESRKNARRENQNGRYTFRFIDCLRGHSRHDQSVRRSCLLCALSRSASALPCCFSACASAAFPPARNDHCWHSWKNATQMPAIIVTTYAPRCRCHGCPGRAAFVRSAETWRGQSPRPRPARSCPCLRKPNQTKRASDHSKARKEAGACGARTHLAEGGGSGHADGQRPGPLISHPNVVVHPALAQILEPAEGGAERRKPRDRQPRVVVAPCPQQRSAVRVVTRATAQADRCCTHRAL
eukprot:COSAG04_NODE_4489_length_2058_cov_1.403777_2_plen_238_part_00